MLHSWEGLPEELPSDLDMAVHPKDLPRLGAVFRKLRSEGYEPVRAFRYAIKGYRFDLAWLEQFEMGCVGLDITYGYTEGGLTLMRGEDLVSGRRREGAVWVASAEREFAYLLARRALKGGISERQATRLKRLVEELGPCAAERITAGLLGARSAKRVVQACSECQLAGLLPSLRIQLWINVLKRNPLNPVRHAIGNTWRLIRRWLRPAGLFVVILGPDGAGKSTLVGRLTDAFSPAFSTYRIFHFRPMTVFRQKETGRLVANPHDEVPRGGLGSVAALCAILLDYWLGYAFVLRPVLGRAGLVVFDRYFQDILIDPLRYRYGGPLWVPWLLSKLVPPPDLLFLVLDAEEDVILSRKRELPEDELRRQRFGYKKFARSFTGAALIKTDEGIEHTTQGACRVLIDQLSSRFRRQHRGW